MAEELQLKGLMQQEIQTAAPSTFVDKPSSVAKEETSPPLEGVVAVTDNTVAADL